MHIRRPERTTRGSRLPWPLAGALTLTLALLASCGGAPPDAARPAPAPPSPTPQEEDPAEPPEDPSPEPDDDEVRVPREMRFEAPKLGGGRVRGAEYSGRDVAIWFWAPW